MQLTPSRWKGFAMVLTAAVLWGLSGTVAQHLFQREGFSPGWLVTVRLLAAGLLLLAFAGLRQGWKTVWSVWRERRDRWRLAVFGVIGMLGVQYTYFAAIDAGNAATATLLQYLGPVLITLYLAFRSRRLPGWREAAAVGLAILGTFLLVTRGDPSGLSITGAALFWGLASAASLAFYTLHPAGLLARHGSLAVVGWGMVIGGTGLVPLAPPWALEGARWSVSTVLAVGFVVLFGTLLAFTLYLASLRHIRPAETSLLACAEPLSAAVAAVLWLQVPFTLPEWLGGFCILATVAVLSQATGPEQVVSEAASTRKEHAAS